MLLIIYYLVALPHLAFLFSGRLRGRRRQAVVFGLAATVFPVVFCL